MDELNVKIGNIVALKKYEKSKGISIKRKYK